MFVVGRTWPILNAMQCIRTTHVLDYSLQDQYQNQNSNQPISQLQLGALTKTETCVFTFRRFLEKKIGKILNGKVEPFQPEISWSVESVLRMTHFNPIMLFWLLPNSSILSPLALPSPSMEVEVIALNSALCPSNVFTVNSKVQRSHSNPFRTPQLHILY